MISTIINIMLNIYTFSIMLSMVCLVLYFIRTKQMLDKLDIFEILELGPNSVWDTVKSIAACLFMPGVNLLFCLAIIILCVIPIDKAAEFMNMAIKESIKKQKEDNNE